MSAPAVSRAGTNEANLASADCFRAMEESRFLAWSRKRASRILVFLSFWLCFLVDCKLSLLVLLLVCLHACSPSKTHFAA